MTLLAPGAIVAHRYRIRRELGRGAYGFVYEAARLDGAALVALKVMHERLGEDEVGAERFAREAQMLRELSHPHIVQIVDFGIGAEGLPFIAFELLTGTTLQDVATPMAVGECVRVARQLLNALGAAHAKGIVHRDIKPGNVFLCDSPPGLVKVLDFGIAKTVVGDLRTALTATGQMVGTPRYMSPEQVRGGEVDARCDLYAVGAMLAELYTGEPLVKGNTAIELFMKLMSEEPLELSAELASSPLGEVVKKAVSKLPEERFEDASAMIASLDAIASDADRAALPAPVFAPVGRPAPAAPPPVAARRRKAWPLFALVGGLGVGVLLFGVGLGLRLARHDGSDRDEVDEPADEARSKGKKRRKRKNAPAVAPAPVPALVPGGYDNTVELEASTVRDHLVGQGFTVEHMEAPPPKMGFAIATFTVAKGERNPGLVMVIYAENEMIMSAYRKDAIPAGSARIIKGHTVIAVTLPLGDPRALASSLAALVREHE